MSEGIAVPVSAFLVTYQSVELKYFLAFSLACVILEIFNNLGAVVYDGTANNQIQIVCIDDTDSAAIYSYTISTYTADNTPN